MRSLNKIVVLILSIGANWVCPVSAAAESTRYQVQAGDTLSEVVWHLFPTERVWGKYGRVKRVLSLNPNVHDPNALTAGDWLDLGSPADPRIYQEASNDPDEALGAEELARMPAAVSPPISQVSTTVEEPLAPLVKPDFDFELSPRFSYLGFTARDRASHDNVEFDSRNKITFGIGASQKLRPSLRSFEIANISLMTIRPVTGLGPITQNKKMQGDAMAGVEWAATERLAFKLGAGFGRETFARFADKTEVQLATLILPLLDVEASYQLYRTRHSVLGSELAYQTIFGSSGYGTKAELGSQINPRLYLAHVSSRGEADYRVETTFSFRHQNSTGSTQNEKEFGLGLRAFFGFGRQAPSP